MVRIDAQKRQAFTLVELLVVIVVIAVLAAVAIPKFQDSAQRAREAAVKEQIAILRKAMSNFNADTDRFPIQITDLQATTPPATGYSHGGSEVPLHGFKGPYIQEAIPGPMIGRIAYEAIGGDGRPHGRVYCPLPGNDLSGKPYSSW